VSEGVNRRDGCEHLDLPSRPARKDAVGRSCEAAGSERGGHESRAAKSCEREPSTEREEGGNGREVPRLGRAVAVEEDRSAMDRMANETGQRRARRVHAGEVRRDMDALLRRDRPQDRCVIVGEANVRVMRPKPREGRVEQRARRQEARRPFRKAVELLGSEARRARIVEILTPGELREQPPELAERVVGVDVDVTVPDRLGRQAATDEPERIRMELYARVEKQYELAACSGKTGTPRFETTAVRLREDAKRNPPVDGFTRHFCAPVCRTVVDEHDLRVDLRPVERSDERVHRALEMRSFVVDWNHDTQRGCRHGSTVTASEARVRAMDHPSMLNRYWRAAVQRLDRPGRRRLLPVPASVWVSFRYRRPCALYWRDGAWIHHYRGAKIPHRSIGRAAPPDVFTAEAREIFLAGYTPREGDVVFDIGAGIGAETLVFSRLVGTSGRVVSIEAHPGTYARLVDLCRVNRLSNVTPLQVAVAETEGEATISDLANHSRNTLVENRDEGINVRVRRIDRIAAEFGIECIDLLKMNIEGAEPDAIRGMGQLLSNTGHVCISCHDFLADEGGPDSLRTKAVVRELLTKNGFNVTSHDGTREPWRRDYLYGSNART
jgi:FkbM family methyltransferase